MSEREKLVDRSKWGSGEWDDEPDRVEFKTKTGLPALIARGYGGVLCGYVAVPPGHAAHGKPFGDLDVSVHGGLTYYVRAECEILATQLEEVV